MGRARSILVALVVGASSMAITSTAAGVPPKQIVTLPAADKASVATRAGGLHRAVHQLKPSIVAAKNAKLQARPAGAQQAPSITVNCPGGGTYAATVLPATSNTSSYASKFTACSVAGYVISGSVTLTMSDTDTTTSTGAPGRSDAAALASASAMPSR